MRHNKEVRRLCDQLMKNVALGTLRFYFIYFFRRSYEEKKCKTGSGTVYGNGSDIYQRRAAVHYCQSRTNRNCTREYPETGYG